MSYKSVICEEINGVKVVYLQMIINASAFSVNSNVKRAYPRTNQLSNDAKKYLPNKGMKVLGFPSTGALPYFISSTTISAYDSTAFEDLFMTDLDKNISFGSVTDPVMVYTQWIAHN